MPTLKRCFFLLVFLLALCFSLGSKKPLALPNGNVNSFRSPLFSLLSMRNITYTIWLMYFKTVETPIDCITWTLSSCFGLNKWFMTDENKHTIYNPTIFVNQSIGTSLTRARREQPHGGLRMMAYARQPGLYGTNIRRIRRRHCPQWIRRLLGRNQCWTDHELMHRIFDFTLWYLTIICLTTAFCTYLNKYWNKCGITSTVYICNDESGLLEHVRIFQIMDFQKTCCQINWVTFFKH